METYNVIHLRVTRAHPDPWGDHLADLVVYLKDANDSDLVLVEFLRAVTTSLHSSWRWKPYRMDIQFHWSMQRLASTFVDRVRWTAVLDRPDSRAGATLRACKKGCSRNLRNVTYSGLRTVALRKQPERAPAERRIPIHKSAWVTAELRRAACCQRIVNASDPEVKEHFSPSKLMDPVQRLREDYHSSHLRITNEIDLEGIIIPGLTCSLARMVPVREDESGFGAFCIHSHIGWIKVRFIRRFEFAHQRLA